MSTPFYSRFNSYVRAGIFIGIVAISFNFSAQISHAATILNTGGAEPTYTDVTPVAAPTSGNVPQGGACDASAYPSNCASGFTCAILNDVSTCQPVNAQTGTGEGNSTVGTGGTCYSSYDCQSHSCDPTSNTCSAPTSIPGNSSGDVTIPGNSSGNTSSTCTSSGSSASGALTNPLKVACFQDLLGEIMKIVVLLGGMFLTLMLIYVGFLFVSARGNEEKISSARTALLWTIIGGLILLGAQAITTVITTTALSL